MAAVTESIKVVLMRLNCRRYCRPLPPLIPSVPPLFVRRLRCRRRRRFKLSPLSSYRVAFYCTTISSFLPQTPRRQHAPGSLWPLLWILFFSPSAYDFKSCQLPPPLRHPLWYICSPRTMVKTIQQVYFCIAYLGIIPFHYFLHFETRYAVKRLNILRYAISRLTHGKFMTANSLFSAGYSCTRRFRISIMLKSGIWIYRAPINLHWNWFSRLEFIRTRCKAQMMNGNTDIYVYI